MKILVCGGRDYKDAARVDTVLSGYRKLLSELICGGAPGADTLAWDWAWSNRFRCERYMADWKTHGRAAGPIRNQRMLDEGKPDLVIAFPGGRGTADMMKRAKAAGVPVIEVTP
jgi:hypothetical protein